MVSALVFTPARADRIPLPPELQDKVNTAVDDGIVILKKTQLPDGSWVHPADKLGGAYRVGYAALPALTLLECGESPNLKAIKDAAAFVRSKVPEIDGTYELALSILFLDRLGSPSDKKHIQTMALRLIAAQTATGGWGYKCPKMDPVTQKNLLTTLQRLNPLHRTLATDKPGTEATGNKPPTTEKADPGRTQPVRIPAELQILPVLQDPSKQTLQDLPNRQGAPLGATTDNSNTQFATLALWTAQKYDIPLERTMQLLLRRFESSQHKDTGAWEYYYVFGGGGEAPAMDCCGLIGLAVGTGAGLAGLDKDARARKAQDPRVVNALAALSKHIGEPTGRMNDIPQQNLYFLWSLERVGVIYDLPKIAGKDWYRWAAEMLVANQTKQGYWDKGLYPGATPILDTCMALLVLKKANLARGVNENLNINRDELDQAVRERVGLTAISTADPVKPPPKPEPPKVTPPPTQPNVAAPPPATHPGIAVSPPPAPSPAPVTPTPPPPVTTEKPAKDNSTLWAILLLVLCVLLVVGCGILVWRYYAGKSKDPDAEEEEGDEKVRVKKKGKSGAKKKAPAPETKNGATTAEAPAKAEGVTTATGVKVKKKPAAAEATPSKAPKKAPVEVAPVEVAPIEEDPEEE
jgi:hypothetical protein